MVDGQRNFSLLEFFQWSNSNAVIFACEHSKRDAIALFECLNWRADGMKMSASIDIYTPLEKLKTPDLVRQPQSQSPL
jgi:hypothetical protein